VLVVGAGPAGCSAAYGATKNGAKVIVVEEHAVIGQPIRCGEQLPMYLSAWFPFEIPKNLLKRKINGVTLNFEDYKILCKGFFWESYVINRDEFDSYIAKNAALLGASFLTSTKYLHFEKKNYGYLCYVKNKNKVIKIKCKYIIAADGCQSAFWELLRDKPASKDIGYIHGWELGEVKLDDWRFNHYFLGNFAPTGYGYIFPKINTVNAGVGGIRKKYKQEDFLNFSSSKEFKRVIPQFKFLNKKSGEISVFRPSIGEWGIDNVFFVGEAANMSVKPLGDGIPLAVISGYHAGVLAAQGKDRSEYSKKLLGELGWLISRSYGSLADLKKIVESKEKVRPLIFLGYLTGAIRSNEIDNALSKKPSEILNQIDQYNSSLTAGLVRMGEDIGFRAHWLGRCLKNYLKKYDS